MPSSTPKTGSPSDVELVKLSLQSAENFRFIIEKYQPKLLRYITYFTGLDQNHAEDIVQETFLKVYRNLNGFNPHLNFSSWIYRIAHNEALNYLKKNKKHHHVSLENDEEGAVSLINVLASEENVSHNYSRQEMAEKVWNILSLMREDYREVLILKFIEDYDYNRISEILKKPLGTVGVLISRAKESFKQQVRSEAEYNLTKASLKQKNTEPAGNPSKT